MFFQTLRALPKEQSETYKLVKTVSTRKGRTYTLYSRKTNDSGSRRIGQFAAAFFATLFSAGIALSSQNIRNMWQKAVLGSVKYLVENEVAERPLSGQGETARRPFGTKKVVKLQDNRGKSRDISYYTLSEAERIKFKKMKKGFTGTIYLAAFARCDEQTIKEIKVRLGLPKAHFQVVAASDLEKKMSSGQIKKDERIVMLYDPNQSGPEVALLEGSMFHALANAAQNNQVPHLMLYHSSLRDPNDIPTFFRSESLGDGNHYFVSYPRVHYLDADQADIEEQLSDSALARFLLNIG